MISLPVYSLRTSFCWVVASVEDARDGAVSFWFDNFASAPWIFCSLEAEDDGADGIRDCWTVAGLFCFDSFASAPWMFCSWKDKDDGEDGIIDTGLGLLLRIRFEALGRHVNSGLQMGDYGCRSRELYRRMGFISDVMA